MVDVLLTLDADEGAGVLVLERATHGPPAWI
jgi:hypothetical protein